MPKKTKEEVIDILKSAKALLENATTKAEAIQCLQLAGNGAGYKPAFRALVQGLPAEESVKWEDK